MYQISSLTTEQSIHCKQQYSSKKRVLEAISELLAEGQKRLSPNKIFEILLNRERLGSTALGKGIALPHGRIENIEKPIIAILTLENGVDFEAPDEQPVDIIFALLVPIECNEKHLQLLAALASLFNESDFREKIRGASEPIDIIQTLESADNIDAN